MNIEHCLLYMLFGVLDVCLLAVFFRECHHSIPLKYKVCACVCEKTKLYFSECGLNWNIDMEYNAFIVFFWLFDISTEVNADWYIYTYTFFARLYAFDNNETCIDVSSLCQIITLSTTIFNLANANDALGSFFVWYWTKFLLSFECSLFLMNR